jgi:probable rRNA maturation factor
MKPIRHYRPSGPRLYVDYSAVSSDVKIGYQLKSVVREAIRSTLAYEEFCRNTEVSVTFCDNEYIRSLNAEFRNKDSATDVLSFPIYEKGEAKETADEPVTLGDIVLSLERTEEQAKELGHSFLRELAFLTIHSTLHLLGYDHELSSDDEEDMCRRQREIIETLNIDFK